MHSSLLPHPSSPAPTYALSLNLIHSIASSQYDRFAHQMTLHFVFAVLLFCNQMVQINSQIQIQRYKPERSEAVTNLFKHQQ